MTSTDEWIHIVEDKFKDGCPNGLLLGWDRNRFLSSIKAICEDCKVTNETDFNYAYCNTYQIRPRTLTEAFIFEMTLNISFVVMAYTLHWTRYSLDLTRGKVVPSAEVKCDPADGIADFMKQNKYDEMPSEWFDVRVRNVQLELAEEASLGKCLFHDYE